nr:MAG TPA: hypothetical protein [Caudoviricetes sp.]
MIYLAKLPKASRQHIHIVIVARRWMEGTTMRLIDRVPTVDDAVIVVRCKDCAAWKRNVGIVDSPNGHCFEHDIDTNGQDFCSYGEYQTNTGGVTK